MLSQYKGTLATFENITNLSDYGHYKLPQQKDSHCLQYAEFISSW